MALLLNDASRMHQLIRYASYPIIMGAVFFLTLWLGNRGYAYWPLFPVIAATGLAMVALLEPWLPYEKSWQSDHGDTVDDILHLFTTQALIQTAIALSFGMAFWLPQELRLWPQQWPMWAQILLAGGIIDLGLYGMHRYSHVQPFLWKLHALHHSPERLYWLNGGRRHALSGLVLAAPGLSVLLALGATPIAVGAWFTFMSVHLAFQHANLDYKLGPFRYLLGVAELHRWHHKRDYEDAEVNFGEVWMIWDHLFGSFYDAKETPRAGEVGLKHERIPNGYLKQLSWPFRA